MNKVIISGNLGADPELRNTNNGTAVCKLSVATSWKGKDGKEDTQWHNVIVRGKQGESCKEFLTKGSKVLVEGRIQSRKYEDKNKQEKYITEIIAQGVEFLSPKSNGTGETNPVVGSDDIPF